MFTSLTALVGSAVLLAAGPDRVKLVDGGKVLEGRVVSEGANEIVLRKGGKDQRIPRNEIAEIHSLERSLSSLIDRDLKSSDAKALEAMATECEQAGLVAEAKNLWIRVLLADPTHAAAVKALGAQRIKDEVKVPFGKEKHKLSDLAVRQASWKHSYAIETTHFVLRSDLDLAYALDLSIALERFYRRFYDTLGHALELYVFDEAPEVSIYGHSADFPVGPEKSDLIWFAPGINRLHVLAETDPSVASVVHEMSRLMLFNALRRSAGATAQVPQWTVIGIAQMFAKAAPTERFGPWSEIGKPDPTSFELAQSANLPFERVFNATANDFSAEAKSAEMTASAYSLVHFFVFDKDGWLRANYGRFLREGAKGKISMNALTGAVGLNAKELESQWRAYIAAHAQ